jgi:hypothetical protein
MAIVVKDLFLERCLWGIMQLTLKLDLGILSRLVAAAVPVVFLPTYSYFLLFFPISLHELWSPGLLVSAHFP